jgi:hypothetical protein
VSYRDDDEGITITIPWWVIGTVVALFWVPTCAGWIYRFLDWIGASRPLNDGSLTLAVLVGVPAMFTLPVLIGRKVMSSTKGALKRRLASIDPTIFDDLVVPRLVIPPGTRVLAALSWLPVQNKTIQRVFKPVIGDMQLEYIEAVAANNEWRALAIRIRYYGIIFLTLVTFVLSATLKRVVEIWKLTP